MAGGRKGRPACYGMLDRVFPKGGDDLRHTPKDCLPCTYKTACLRSALEGASGLKLQEERVDRAYSSGMMGFLERWSKKKDLRRRIGKKQ